MWSCDSAAQSSQQSNTHLSPSRVTFSSPRPYFHRSCSLYFSEPMFTFHLELQHVKFLQQSNIQRLIRKLTGKNQFRAQKSVIHYSPKLQFNILLQKADARKDFSWFTLRCNSQNQLLFSLSGNNSSTVASVNVVFGSWKASYCLC